MKKLISIKGICLMFIPFVSEACASVVEFNHNRENICDYEGSGIHNYSEVIQEMDNSLLKNRLTSVEGVTLNLEGNYIEDKGVSAIVEYLTNDVFFKNHLTKLDLSNNRFTKSALPLLLLLVEKCPILEELNISINYFGQQDYAAAFANLDQEKRKIVKFRAY